MNHFKLRKATEKSAKIFNKTSMQSMYKSAPLVKMLK